jgi:hypothetical protein
MRTPPVAAATAAAIVTNDDGGEIYSHADFDAKIPGLVETCTNEFVKKKIHKRSTKTTKPTVITGIKEYR